MSAHTRGAGELGAVEIDGMTRSAFLVRGAVATGTVYGAGMVTPFIRRAIAQGSMGDVDILNFALSLELLETAFYERAQKLPLADEIAALAERFGGEEAEHVDALKSTITQLGGRPDPEPRFTFPIDDEASFLKLAVTLEDTGVSAYNGAGPGIRSKDVLAAAGSIVQVEARHAAAIRLAADQDPAPEAFDKALPAAQVQDAVKPFIRA